MSKAIYTENKLREIPDAAEHGFNYKSWAKDLDNGNYKTFPISGNHSFKEGEVYVEGKEYFIRPDGIAFAAIPLQEPTDRWRQVKKNGHLEWEVIPKTKDEILRQAGKYADNYEKENGFTVHPKTASFHGYVAGYDDAKLDEISQPQEPTETEDDKFKNWLEGMIENFEMEKELHGKKERIQARLSMLKETLENYNRWK